MPVRRLDRAREGECVGHRAVAGDAPGEHRGALDRRARHQPFDALVHVAESRLEPHDRLAVRREAEVSGLDDAGVHGTDRDLVQAFAFGGQERIGAGGATRFVRLVASGMAATCRGRAMDACRRDLRVRAPRGRGSPAPDAMAGGCDCPTDGKRWSSQTRLNTPSSPSSSSAMWTCSRSAHSPSNVHCPADKRSMACRQPSRLTTARGHGAWCSTCRPARMRSRNLVACRASVI